MAIKVKNGQERKLDMNQLEDNKATKKSIRYILTKKQNNSLKPLKLADYSMIGATIKNGKPES